MTHGFKHFQRYSELRILISPWKPIGAIFYFVMTDERLENSLAGIADNS